MVRFNQGRYKPILEINKIKTIFGKKSERFSDDEIVLAYDENITPEQKSFLQGHNFLKYPTIQELSVNKVSENISSDQTNSENNAGKTSYSRLDRDDRFVNDPEYKKAYDEFKGNIAQGYSLAAAARDIRFLEKSINRNGTDAMTQGMLDACKDWYEEHAL